MSNYHVLAESPDSAPRGLILYLNGYLPSEDEAGHFEPSTKRRKLSEDVEEVDRESIWWSDHLILAQVHLYVTFAPDLDPSGRTFKDDKRIPIVLKGSFEKSNGKAGARATGERAQIPEHDGDYMCVFGYKDDRGREKTGSFNLEAPWTPELRRILENCRNLQESTSSCTHNFAKSICEVGRLDGKDFTAGLTLHIKLIWKNSHSLEDARMDELNDLLKLVTPGGRQYSMTTVSQDRFFPRDFYDSVYVPPKDMETSDTIESNQLTCHLYPFQKRAVQWLFLRECREKYKAPVRTPSKSGFIIKVPPRDSSQTDMSAAEWDTETSAQISPCDDFPHGFFSTKDADGQECFVSHWLGIVTTDKSLISSLGSNLSGGILAEEMGLGKTVEMIGLICLHQRPESQILEQLTDGRTRISRATLVITPPSILQQWNAEIHVHAPSLRVMIYEGITRAETDDDTVAKLLEYDIVLSTYQIIGKEIHYTTPDRTLRHEKRYEKRKSPLVRIDWWRVVLDECQMVESGVSNAARVARMIPRRNAWAVSGTPLKKDAQDLFGLLLFLDLKPYCFSAPLWESLVTNYKPVFKQLVSTIALRHTKAQVKGDIKLPPQKRLVLTIPFTHIEEQHYSTLYRRMCEDCNVDSEGNPAVDDWSPESYATKMRQWLTRLRQTCLHPAVGYQNSRDLGRHLGGTGPLRTVKQVLQVMINHNEAACNTAERSYLQAKLRRGQYLERDNHTEAALTIWLEVLDYANKMIKECRRDLQSIKESDCRTTSADSEISNDSSDDDEPLEDSKGRAQVRSRLRSALELAHTSTFFTGNAYFQIKSDPEKTLKDSERYKELDRAETETYEKARQLRKEILKQASSRVENLMAKIHSKAKKQEFTQIPNFRPLAFSGGIESRNLLMRLGDLCEAVNVQAETIDKWREKLIELLLQPLVDQEEVEIQGDEYEASTKQQEEIYAYEGVLRAVIADRHDALTGQTNVLIRGDMALALNRATNGEGHAPRLMLRLLRKRDEAKPGADLGSIRGIITMLRVLKTRLQGQEDNGSQRVAAELEIVTQALTKLQKDATKQATAVTNLERELDTFKETMNARLDYYRQLQIISDAVAPLNEIADDRLQGHIEEQSANEARLLGQIATQKARGRYLLNLQEEPAMGITERTCIICTDTFVIGLLTSCGHSYCKVCFQAWYRDNRNCPVCKTYLKEKEIRQITYNPQEIRMEEEIQTAGLTSRSDSLNGIYSGINTFTLEQIKGIDVQHSYGSKIDTLIRHVLWIRQNDNGAKSIIFSQFKDFLDTLAKVFSECKIGYDSIDHRNGTERFMQDPSVECFLLHARAQSSGLNLVNATHVILCEPLINTALELQAIARVHRIGQYLPTTVWMYIVEDTVEKAIYDISVQRRLAHITQVGEERKKALQDPKGKGKARADLVLEDELEAANSLELRDAPLAKLLEKGAEGELVDRDDLWNCLFSHKTANRVEERVKEVGKQMRADAAEERAVREAVRKGTRKEANLG